jgi:hypothetical protein
MKREDLDEKLADQRDHYFVFRNNPGHRLLDRIQEVTISVLPFKNHYPFLDAHSLV